MEDGNRNINRKMMKNVEKLSQNIVILAYTLL